LDDIEEFSENIHRHGVQQPIKVYPHGRGYRIAFGERRYLAAKLAGEKTIPAWVLPERPKFLRTLQFSENELRERLKPWERLENIRLIIEEMEAFGEEQIDSASALAKAIGLRLSMANNYFDLLQGPDDVREALRTGKISNIELAAEIAREPDPDKRRMALAVAAAGAKARQTRETLKAAGKVTSTGRGRPATRVSFGSTNKPVVVRRIVEAVLGDSYAGDLDMEVDWNDYRSVTEAWKKLLKYLEAMEREKP
jgi:ParB family chromosome partitioning protein